MPESSADVSSVCAKTNNNKSRKNSNGSVLSCSQAMETPDDSPISQNAFKKRTNPKPIVVRDIRSNWLYF